MSKLAERGIIWIGDSEIYVADKSLYANASDFLKAVIEHIKGLTMDDECGWCVIPEFDKTLPHVTTNYMVHRVNSDWHDAPFWELADESGRGHREVWCIDFESVPAGEIER